MSSTGTTLAWVRFPTERQPVNDYAESDGDEDVCEPHVRQRSRRGDVHCLTANDRLGIGRRGKNLFYGDSVTGLAFRSMLARTFNL